MKAKTFAAACALLLLSIVKMSASPAYRFARQVQQSDGTTLVIQRAGDEHFSYYTTTDGVPVIKAENGDFCYARFLNSGRLGSTNRIAHEKAVRNRVEADVADLVTTEFTERMSASAPMMRYGIGRQADASVNSIGARHIPVILVQFSDIKFMASNTVDKFNDHFNGVNYTDEGGPGSVRDYFIQQSDSLFQPTFDLIGPVTLSKNAAYYGQNNRNGSDMHDGEMIAEALTLALNAGTDFTPYTENNAVPFVAIIYAGYGEQACDTSMLKGTIYESTGADNTVWAKYRPALNATNGSITFRAALCTNEVGNYDLKGAKIDGIGTFCHEFSHAMGLPDFYGPTGVFGLDYWDIMDYGQFVSYGVMPVGYSAYERNFMGWLDIDTLQAVKQGVTLAPLASGTGKRAYKIVNPQSNDGQEYYILENRQRSNWFHRNFGYGMLIYHVDYLESAWTGGTVNTVKSHQRITLLPADGVLTPASSVTSFNQYRGDLFPGYLGVTSLTNETTPCDTAYYGGYMNVAINQIHTDASRNIVFAYMADGFLNTPTDLKAAASESASTESGRTFISWAPVEHASQYVVSITRGNDTISIDTVGTTAYTFNHTADEATYTANVMAIAPTYIDSEPAGIEFTALPTGISQILSAWGDVNVEVYSVTGQKLSKGKLTGLIHNARLPRGIYVIRNGEQSRKVYIGQ